MLPPQSGQRDRDRGKDIPPLPGFPKRRAAVGYLLGQIEFLKQ